MRTDERDPWGPAVASLCAVLAVAAGVTGAIAGRVTAGLVVAGTYSIWAFEIFREHRGERGRILSGGDPREEEIDVIALAAAYGATATGVSVWLLVSLANGDSLLAPSLILGGGAVAYLASVEILRRRM